MRNKKLALVVSTLVLGGFVLLRVAHAESVTVDAVSGASGGRKTVTVSAVNVTTTTSAISFSEMENNGSLRLYYSTTAFANTGDTSRATVTKKTVTVRGSGTTTISGISAGTKYYYKFQGWYQKGVSNYWATGSFTTTSASSIRTDLRQIAPAPGQGSVDALGRSRHGAAGVAIDAQGATIRAKSERR